MDCSVWTVQYGLFDMDCLIRTVRYGLFNMDCSKWAVQCGLFNMDYVFGKFVILSSQMYICQEIMRRTWTKMQENVLAHGKKIGPVDTQ